MLSTMLFGIRILHIRSRSTNDLLFQLVSPWGSGNIFIIPLFELQFAHPVCLNNWIILLSMQISVSLDLIVS
jgi:hypothetical protein